jgi:serine acetyltransferase
MACVADIVNIIAAERTNTKLVTLRNKTRRDNSVVYSKQIYTALLKCDCHPEAVAAAIKHGKGVVVETIDLLITTSR